MGQARPAGPPGQRLRRSSNRSAKAHGIRPAHRPAPALASANSAQHKITTGVFHAALLCRRSPLPRPKKSMRVVSDNYRRENDSTTEKRGGPSINTKTKKLLHAIVECCRPPFYASIQYELHSTAAAFISCPHRPQSPRRSFQHMPRHKTLPINVSPTRPTKKICTIFHIFSPLSFTCRHHTRCRNGYPQHQPRSVRQPVHPARQI